MEGFKNKLHRSSDYKDEAKNRLDSNYEVSKLALEDFRERFQTNLLFELKRKKFKNLLKNQSSQREGMKSNVLERLKNNQEELTEVEENKILSEIDFLVDSDPTWSDISSQDFAKIEYFRYEYGNEFYTKEEFESDIDIHKLHSKQIEEFGLVKKTHNIGTNGFEHVYEDRYSGEDIISNLKINKTGKPFTHAQILNLVANQLKLNKDYKSVMKGILDPNQDNIFLTRSNDEKHRFFSVYFVKDKYPSTPPIWILELVPEYRGFGNNILIHSQEE